MNYCIELIDSVLGLPPPEVIEGQFYDGSIDGTVNLTWPSKDFQITSNTLNGVLDGIFKAHDAINDRWMIGKFTKNKLLKSDKMNCWIIEKNVVIIRIT